MLQTPAVHVQGLCFLNDCSVLEFAAGENKSKSIFNVGEITRLLKFPGVKRTFLVKIVAGLPTGERVDVRRGFVFTLRCIHTLTFNVNEHIVSILHLALQQKTQTLCELSVQFTHHFSIAQYRQSVINTAVYNGLMCDVWPPAQFTFMDNGLSVKRPLLKSTLH